MHLEQQSGTRYPTTNLLEMRVRVVRIGHITRHRHAYTPCIFTCAGLDSLGTVEVCAALQRVLHVEVVPTVLYDYPTITVCCFGWA